MKNKIYRSIDNTINLENLQMVHLKPKNIKLYYENGIRYSMEFPTIPICVREYYSLVEAWEKYNAVNS
jgi:hypothetical protein